VTVQHDLRQPQEVLDQATVYRPRPHVILGTEQIFSLNNCFLYLACAYAVL